MQILLFILKLIGIIFLALIGIVLLAVTMILFVPIRYEASGEIKDDYQIEAGGVLRYLFSVFKFVLSYRNGALTTDLYLFGHRKSLSENMEDLEPLNEEEIFEDEILQEESSNQEIETFKSIEDIPTEVVHSEKEVSNKSQKKVLIEEIKQSKEEDFDNKKKIKKHTKSKQTGKSQNTEKTSFDFALIKKELTDEHNHNVIKKFLKELKYLLMHFKFRKINTDLIFGAGDPALTGQILGILSVIPVMYWYEFKITPDFMSEEAYVKGTFCVAGRIRLIHLLLAALRLIFDKEVRIVINKFMNMIS